MGFVETEYQRIGLLLRRRAIHNNRIRNIRGKRLSPYAPKTRSAFKLGVTRSNTLLIATDVLRLRRRKLQIKRIERKNAHLALAAGKYVGERVFRRLVECRYTKTIYVSFPLRLVPSKFALD